MLKAAFLLLAPVWCHAKLYQKDKLSLKSEKMKAKPDVAGPEEKARLKRRKEAKLKQERMLEVIKNLTIKSSGSFLSYDGTIIPW